jgi:hypothetical protein
MNKVNIGGRKIASQCRLLYRLTLYPSIFNGSAGNLRTAGTRMEQLVLLGMFSDPAFSHLVFWMTRYKDVRLWLTK